jgi:predicted regulator of Ras-like GTPase activity (Roadblock/LC7/MglB family)
MGAAALLGVAVLALLAFAVPAAASVPRVDVTAAFAPNAVLPGEATTLAVVVTMWGEDERDVTVHVDGLDGFALLAEEAPVGCDRTGWKWVCDDVATGAHAFALTVATPAAWEGGTDQEVTVRVADAKSVLRAATATLWIVGTNVVVDVAPLPTPEGATVAYAVVLETTGPGSAPYVRLDVTPDDGAVVVDASPQPTVWAGQLTWEFRDVAPGTTVVEVALATDAETAGVEVEVLYADASGRFLPTERTTFSSMPLPPETAAPQAMALPWFLPLLALSGAGVAGAWAAQRGVLPWPNGVREAYVISKAGLLLAHRTRSGAGGEADEDIMAGMFTAVRQFALDAVGDARGLVQLRVGDARVTFVEGQHAVVALVSKGFVGRGAVVRAANGLARFEALHGDVLRAWDGRFDGAPAFGEAADTLAASLV